MNFLFFRIWQVEFEKQKPCKGFVIVRSFLVLFNKLCPAAIPIIGMFC
jgi:hypothetical protein